MLLGSAETCLAAREADAAVARRASSRGRRTSALRRASIAADTPNATRLPQPGEKRELRMSAAAKLREEDVAVRSCRSTAARRSGEDGALEDEAAEQTAEEIRRTMREARRTSLHAADSRSDLLGHKEGPGRAVSDRRSARCSKAKPGSGAARESAALPSVAEELRVLQQLTSPGAAPLTGCQASPAPRGSTCRESSPQATQQPPAYRTLGDATKSVLTC